MSIESQAWCLKERPQGLPKQSDFEKKGQQLNAVKDGEILVENHYLSVDPYMRGRMNDTASYIPPFQIGSPMDGGAIGRVLESSAEGFNKGDLIRSMHGWRTHYVANAKGVEKLPEIDGVPIQAYLGVLGMPGLTAYTGTLAICKPVKDETIFVSGAAGAVGSLVGQIAKIKGASVVGSVGSTDKADYIKSIGYDEAINYKTTKNLLNDLLAAAPKGIDMYFDNVGSEHLEAALFAANRQARMALCGMISQYNNTQAQPGPSNLILMVGKSILAKGFIVSDYLDMSNDFIKDMSQWILEGKLTWRETPFDGMDASVEAFLSLFSGGNTGKALIRLK